MKSSTTALLIDPEVFWRPKIKGVESSDAPSYCFLVSHGREHILFDLGVRRDWENYAPSTVKLLKATTTVRAGKNISEILDSDTSDLNIRSHDITAIIWSHHHFDHIGDPSTFPAHTTLVVGPGFSSNILPGYPTNPSSPILSSDTADRPVHELSFETELRIGRFPAIDYFHDGSLYLLSAPGHTTDHICALARVTSSPDSFILMAADACHYPGLLRPSPYLPLPRTAGNMSGVALQENVNPQKSATEPFSMPGERAFSAQEDAQETIRGIIELDAQDNVLVVLAHDRSLEGELDMFPNAANDWMRNGVKERTRWLFLQDIESALS